MVDWGFDYQALKEMPIDEFYEYIRLLNEEAERRSNQMKGKPADQPADQPVPIGSVVPSGM